MILAYHCGRAMAIKVTYTYESEAATVLLHAHFQLCHSILIYVTVIVLARKNLYCARTHIRSRSHRYINPEHTPLSRKLISLARLDKPEVGRFIAQTNEK